MITLALGVMLLLLGGVVVAWAVLDSGPRGVAHSLSLIEDHVVGSEVPRSDLPASDRILDPLLALARRAGARFTPAGHVARLARQLELAGNPASWNVERLLTAKVLALLGGLLVGAAIAPGGLTRALGAVVLGALASFVPDLLAYNGAQKRQEALRLGLADALDLLTLCVEAGQAFNAAMLQVSQAMTGPVAEEFARVLAEIQIGKNRHDAFSDLASRSTVPEVRTLVTALIQSDRLGVPLGTVLREQAGEMRLVRRQLAEEAAQKVPVKIMLPMILFIFPALFVVLMGPAVMSIVAQFSGK